MKLSERVCGRENNFNLIRLVAAGGVLVTHGYALVGLPPSQEPLRGLVGISFGTVAVDSFFITSGFLVTGSLLVHRRLVEFLWARVLRIFPALFVLVLLMTFALGPCFSVLPASVYLRHEEVFGFLITNLTLVNGVAFYLPGVFDSNPFPRAVNASLWTLPYEVWMYLSLFLIGLMASALAQDRIKVIRVTVALITTVALAAHFVNHFAFQHNEHTTRLCLMFYTGAFVRVQTDRIPLSLGLFLFSVLLLVLSSFRIDTFFLAYNVLLAYILLYLTYGPWAWIRAYNRIGDYSYGAYLYAFPVQQSVAALVPGISLIGMLMIAASVTLAFAMLSWHLLEKPALALKAALVSSGNNRA
jgi:peptidoglycan/LPS O-acetylase OafA/YrhL